jgi:hypothetical protein
MCGKYGYGCGYYCLNADCFEAVEETQEKIEAWRIEYNDSRPHQALKELTPSEFALKSRSGEFGMVPQQPETHFENGPRIPSS